LRPSGKRFRVCRIALRAHKSHHARCEALHAALDSVRAYDYSRATAPVAGPVAAVSVSAGYRKRRDLEARAAIILSPHNPETLFSGDAA